MYVGIHTCMYRNFFVCKYFCCFDIDHLILLICSIIKFVIEYVLSKTMSFFAKNKLKIYEYIRNLHESS